MSASNASLEDVVAVVLEYHKPDSTFKCIKSLAASGIKHIYVWDNSTDSGISRSDLKNLIAEDYQLTDRISISGENSNLGFSAGVNAAISSASKIRKLHYVLIINNDATINTEGVHALQAALAADERNALAAPKYLDSRNKNASRLYYHPWFAALTKRKYWGSTAFLSGCCLLADLQKTGHPLLNEDFFMYGEDVELSFRLQKKGFQLTVAEMARVEHIGAASSVVGSPFYEYHVIRGHLQLTSLIATSRLQLLAIWPARLASLTLRSILRAARSRSLNPLTALWRAIAGLGAAR